MSILNISPNDDTISIICKFNEYFESIQDTKYLEFIDYYKNNNGSFSLYCLYGLYYIVNNKPIQAILWFRLGNENNINTSLYMLILYFKFIKNYKSMIKYAQEYMKKYDHIVGSIIIINYYLSNKKYIQAENMLKYNINKYNDKGSFYTLINHYEMILDTKSWIYYMMLFIKKHNDIEAIDILTKYYIKNKDINMIKFYTEYGYTKYPNDIRMINNKTEYYNNILDKDNMIKYCLEGIEKHKDYYSIAILANYYYNNKEYINMKEYYLMLIKEHNNYEYLKQLPYLTQYYILTNQTIVNVDEYLNEIENQPDIKILKTKIRKCKYHKDCDICYEENKPNIILNCCEHYTCVDCNIILGNNCKICFR